MDIAAFFLDPTDGYYAPAGPDSGNVEPPAAEPQLVGAGLAGADGLLGRCLTYSLQLDTSATQGEQAAVQRSAVVNWQTDSQ